MPSTLIQVPKQSAKHNVCAKSQVIEKKIEILELLCSGLSYSPGQEWGGDSSCPYIHLQITCKMKGLQAAGLVSMEQTLTRGREKKKY